MSTSFLFSSFYSYNISFTPFFHYFLQLVHFSFLWWLIFWGFWPLYFRSFLSICLLCALDHLISEKRLVEPPTLIMDLSISPCISIKFCLILYISVMFLVDKSSKVLFLLGGLYFRSIWKVPLCPFWCFSLFRLKLIFCLKLIFLRMFYFC